MEHTLGERFILDFAFFVIVMIILLNVIFGIIIDTFSDLRSQKESRMFDTLETCFICGINKQVFDRSSDQVDGFKRHIARDHNMWSYFYFLVFIWEQDKDDDDGLELYVRDCVATDDLSWFPINKAMCLPKFSKNPMKSLADVPRKPHWIAALEVKLSKTSDEMLSNIGRLVNGLK
jgi:hypothetical protein